MKKVFTLLLSTPLLAIIAGCTGVQLYPGDITGRWVYNIRYFVHDENKDDWLSIYHGIFHSASEHVQTRHGMAEQIRQFMKSSHISSSTRSNKQAILAGVQLFDEDGEVPWTSEFKTMLEEFIPRLLGVGDQSVWAAVRCLTAYAGSEQGASSYTDYYWPDQADLQGKELIPPDRVPGEKIGAPTFYLGLELNGDDGIPFWDARTGKEIRFDEWQVLRGLEWEYDPVFEIRVTMQYIKERVGDKQYKTLRGEGTVHYKRTGSTLGTVVMEKYNPELVNMRRQLRKSQ